MLQRKGGCVGATSQLQGQMDDTNSGGVVESSQARSFMGLDSVIKICPYNSIIQCVCARFIRIRKVPVRVR